jgi:N-acyl-D-amino-acid deacylase
MGEEATEREATPDEQEQMRQIVAEALEAGAVGFATSKAPTHVGYAGRPVPSRAASLEEIATLASCLGDAGRGLLQATIGAGFFLDELAGIQQQTGRPVSWTALLGGLFGPDGHRGVLERSAKLQEDGIRVIPQVSCRPLVVEFQFKAPFPFESLPLFKRVSEADFAGRKRIYADPDFRAEFRERAGHGVLATRLEDVTVSACPSEPALEERNLGAVARERGVHAADLALDLALASELEARFRMPVANIDEDVVSELINHESTMLGLSDAGAHASQLCDACAPTHLLGHWVRERKALSLEEAVRQLTSEPAEVFGLTDRGLLAVDRPADVTVFDPETVGCSALRRVHDFPAGADRLVADAEGIHAVIVNGVLIRENGVDAVAPDAALPGRVLRGGHA